MPVKSGKKLIIVIGPTASGKSELAVKLAKRVGGEIISADSRQVYRGMNIGSGKIEGRWQKVNGQRSYLYKGVVHHLIDVADPKRQFSVVRYKKLAEKAINDIYRRGKIPILCGGTAHWIDAIAFDQSIPAVKPNSKLRQQLEKKSVEELFARLKKLDPARAKAIDLRNPRRLIRALEIVITTGKPVPYASSPYIRGGKEGLFDVTWLGLKADQKTLGKKIEIRLRQRLKAGMLHEIKTLHKQGVSWKRLESFGLEYKFGALHLQGKISYDDMVAQLSTAIKQYAKRQMTWWKRNKDIRWFRP